MNIYERYGKKSEALEVTTENFNETLKVLNALKRGELKLDDIEVLDSGFRVKRKQDNSGEKAEVDN